MYFLPERNYLDYVKTLYLKGLTKSIRASARVCARGLGLRENIKKVISNFDWNKAFENLSGDGKVDFIKYFIKYFPKLHFKQKD